MSDGLWKVPTSWAWAKAGEVGEILGGGTPPASDPANFDVDGTPWLTPADLSDFSDAYIARGRRSLSSVGLSSSSARVLPKGAVLFSSRAPIGYCVIAANPISTNQGFKSLILKPTVLPEYVRHYLLASVEYIEGMASGTTFKEISGSRMGEVLIPLPPLAEQRRIVARIEALFARTRRARADLERIAPLAQRYIKRVLERETGAQEGQEELQGTNPLEDFVLDTFYGPRFADTSYVKEGGLPTIRTTDMDARGNIALRDPPRVEVSDKEIAKWGLLEGDLLVTRTGSIGRCAVVGPEIGPALPSAYLIRVRLDQSKIRPRFALLSLLAPRGQSHLLAGATAVTQPNINALTLRATPISNLQLAQQDQAVARVDKAFGAVGQIERDTARALALLNHLERSILTRAFRGELVEQDPHDEPAKVELERLRAAPATAGRGRPHKKTMPATEAPVAPRKKGPAVPKNRADADVKGQPYLANHLRQIGSAATTEDLYKAADLSIADFYKQLSEEVAKGWVKDASGKLEAA